MGILSIFVKKKQQQKKNSWVKNSKAQTHIKATVCITEQTILYISYGLLN